MALTITPVDSLENQPTPDGHGLRRSIFDITGDSSYPTGGEAFTPGDVGLSKIFALVPVPTPEVDTQTVAYDEANDKLLIYEAGTEVGNASDQSNTTVRVLIWGRS